MVFFVVAGKPSCPNYNHCIFVADYLQKHLPNFQFRRVELETGKWESWLINVNKMSGWYHLKSPLIWQELTKRNGKRDYIGSISEFWEYCYEYYGLQSSIPKEMLEKLVEHNVEMYKMTNELKEKNASLRRNILIIGASDPSVPLIYPQFQDVEGLGLKLGVNVILYDANYMTGDTDFDETVNLLCKDLALINNNVELAASLKSAIEIADLIIFTENTCFESEEVDYERHLARNMARMYEVGDLISDIGKRSLRIVFANYGPICFNANVLIRRCDELLRPRNVVAITSDLASPYVSVLAAKMDLTLTDLGFPPVWGPVGNTLDSHFVDMDSAVQLCRVERPFARALRVSGYGSTLPLGTVHTELRFLAYLTQELDVMNIVNERQNRIKATLDRPAVLPKVHALMTMLKLWYAPTSSDEIISLGVLSDGSFGIPNGLIFSQPVCLQDNFWKPVSEFPVQERTKEALESFIMEAVDLLEEYV